jgi:hypothetical protein
MHQKDILGESEKMENDRNSQKSHIMHRDTVNFSLTNSSVDNNINNYYR